MCGGLPNLQTKSLMITWGDVEKDRFSDPPSKIWFMVWRAAISRTSFTCKQYSMQCLLIFSISEAYENTKINGDLC